MSVTRVELDRPVDELAQPPDAESLRCDTRPLGLSAEMAEEDVIGVRDIRVELDRTLGGGDSAIVELAPAFRRVIRPVQERERFLDEPRARGRIISRRGDIRGRQTTDDEANRHEAHGCDCGAADRTCNLTRPLVSPRDERWPLRRSRSSFS